MSERDQRKVEVWADWTWLGAPIFMGTLTAALVRGREVFSFEYAPAWLTGPHAQQLDPALRLFAGPHYAPVMQENFGLFLDSCPDRWGRVLMDRREAQLARDENRKPRKLMGFDYLLGVHDLQRMGALRFRTASQGPFLDDLPHFVIPPWTSLRELEQVCLLLEGEHAVDHPAYAQWLAMLIDPGGSLGGARPKASVVDAQGSLWIAKFPSRRDTFDIGAWEAVAHALAGQCGVHVAPNQTRTFAGKHHTFLAQRFDRTSTGGRMHFASALTLLQRSDGDDAGTGACYLELADLLLRSGAHPVRDLEELWRRIVLFIAIANTDDHLRNHGFLLEPTGWSLTPAYDLNPDPHGAGLRLNITETDNALALDLAREVAPYFRIARSQAEEIITGVMTAVGRWRAVAKAQGISRDEQERMAPAFTAFSRHEPQ